MCFWFQHTAARRRLGSRPANLHSQNLFQHTAARRRLGNSGFMIFYKLFVSTHSRPKAAGTNQTRKELKCVFQHTAARRRLETRGQDADNRQKVSTHSRPKAAGLPKRHLLFKTWSFNTQPPEGGWFLLISLAAYVFLVSTHSRPKAAGFNAVADTTQTTFQHTAARRRLVPVFERLFSDYQVSTHSRPKAAGSL